MKAFYETRLYNTPVPVAVFKISDFSFIAHWHIEVEFIYVLRGNITVGINKEKRVLKQGDFAVSGSGDIHYYDSRGQSCEIIITVFRPDFIGYPAGWPEDRHFLTSFYNISKDNIYEKNKTSNITTSHIKDILSFLLLEINSPAEYADMIIKGKLLELCALTMRILPGNKKVKPDFQLNTGVRIMKNSIKYLENNYQRDITLKDISKSMNLSPCYFSRLFKKISGMNFKEYLNNIRVNKACIALKSTGDTITDIAFGSGFNSIRTFNRVFFSIMECTPSSYR